MQEKLVNKIEAILFYLAEPVSLDFLSKTLEIKKDELMNRIKELDELLKNRGLRTIIHNNEIALVTAPEFSGIIEKIAKEARERELGRAGIETLSIIAYKGPVSRKEVDYIRGVNSQFALRNLMLRGLVERKNSEQDERIMLYTVTNDTLRYLGLGHISELPEYDSVKQQLEVETENDDVEEDEKMED